MHSVRKVIEKLEALGYTVNRLPFGPDGDRKAVVLEVGDGRLVVVLNKQHFSWHRNSRRWMTGNDKHLVENYLIHARRLGKGVWLFFLHQSDEPSESDLSHGCPATCPTGLFGLELASDPASHAHGGHGLGGMYYWTIDKLLTGGALWESFAKDAPKPKPMQRETAREFFDKRIENPGA